MTSVHRTRLAPSPTGALHLGNARTFLINWALAKQHDWHIVLRIDDLDGPRIKPGAIDQAIDVLAWLGLDWHEGPRFQTECIADYRRALRQLIEQRVSYPCRCSRSQIAQALASAPHAGENELRYPGTCRPVLGGNNEADLGDDTIAGWRILVPDREFAFDDQFYGAFVENTQHVVGDFRIAGSGGSASYQLAVVIDDAMQGVDCVVRGDDLLSSTPRQQIIRKHLGLGPEPRYWHVPLVRGADGRRLAKRHGDTRLTSYRERGVTPESIIGLLAEWCGMGARRPMTAAEFAAEFRLDMLPRGPVVLQSADEPWLMAGRE